MQAATQSSAAVRTAIDEARSRLADADKEIAAILGRARGGESVSATELAEARARRDLIAERLIGLDADLQRARIADFHAVREERVAETTRLLEQWTAACTRVATAIKTVAAQMGVAQSFANQIFEVASMPSKYRTAKGWVTSSTLETMRPWVFDRAVRGWLNTALQGNKIPDDLGAQQDATGFLTEFVQWHSLPDDQILKLLDRSADKGADAEELARAEAERGELEVGAGAQNSATVVELPQAVGQLRKHVAPKLSLLAHGAPAAR
jgi:hypothetical protein